MRRAVSMRQLSYLLHEDRQQRTILLTKTEIFVYSKILINQNPNVFQASLNMQRHNRVFDTFFQFAINTCRAIVTTTTTTS